MVASTKLFIQEILFFCALGFCLQGWSNSIPENLPQPPPLPPSLKNRTIIPPPDLPDPSELHAQLEQLGELLNMAPDKLNKLRETIEFIEKMSPHEREAMRIRLSQITQSTPELRREILELAARFPDIQKSDLTQFWFAASVDERAAMRKSLSSTPEKEQLDLLRAKVGAFVKKRNEVFESMRATLEEKRKSIPPESEPKP